MVFGAFCRIRAHSTHLHSSCSFRRHQMSFPLAAMWFQPITGGMKQHRVWHMALFWGHLNLMCLSSGGGNPRQPTVHPDPHHPVHVLLLPAARVQPPQCCRLCLRTHHHHGHGESCTQKLDYSQESNQRSAHVPGGQSDTCQSTGAEPRTVGVTPTSSWPHVKASLSNTLPLNPPYLNYY